MRHRKTFDCDYGRHALVLRRACDGPEFGRVDVNNLAPVVSPVFVPENYAPRHARNDAARKRYWIWAVDNTDEARIVLRTNSHASASELLASLRRIFPDNPSWIDNTEEFQPK